MQVREQTRKKRKPFN